MSITKAGGMYVIITLVSGFAAVNTGNNLLFLIVAALLGFMAVTGLFGWSNLRDLQISLVVPEEVYRGRETLLTLRLANRKRHLPSFLLRLHLMNSSALLPLLPPGQEEAVVLSHTFTERGAIGIGKCTIVSPFPVNFFVRKVTTVLSDQVIVFPEPLVAAFPDAGPRKGREGANASSRAGYEGDVAKISDYSGAEPLKMIHWRLSAKHESLKVKQMTAVTTEPVIVDIDTMPGINVEERLSRCVFLINRLIAANRAVGLKLGCEIIPPNISRVHRLRLLRALALHAQC